MNERYQRTRPRRRPAYDSTQPNRSYPPPVSFDITQPNYPLYPMPEPPRQPPPGYARYARRRRRVGCFVQIFRVVFVGTLFVVLFTCLLIGIYVIAPPPRTNILILGVDARPGEGTATRTDTIILATVDPQQPYVGMLSIPRDLYLTIPGYGPNRINAAHLLGESAIPGSGIYLTQQTIEQNFGVHMDRYMRLNFQAFVAIIDAAGGVEIDVPNYIIDTEYPTPDYGVMTIEFQPGLQHMDGANALIYARTRHTTSDFDRAARQQQVISALMRKLIDPFNWWRIPLVSLEFLANVDTDLTLLDVVQLAPAVIWIGPDGIDRQVLTPEMASGTDVNGASVLTPDWDAINPLIAQMFLR